MTSDPWIITPIAVIGLVLLACGVAGVVNLATVYTIRLPRRVPFPTIRRRALSMRDIIVPGILALLTGALISLASAFLFDGLTRGTTGSLETGVVIFVGVIVAFAIVSAVWFRSGMEIGDLAKDPSTIAAAAKSLHGASPDDANTLRILHRNHQEWKERQGALALSPGTGRPSAAANAAMFRVLPRGRRPQQTRWALLGTLLRIRPLLTTGPIVTVVGVIVALSAIPEHAVPAARRRGRGAPSGHHHGRTARPPGCRLLLVERDRVQRTPLSHRSGEFSRVGHRPRGGAVQDLRRARPRPRDERASPSHRSMGSGRRGSGPHELSFTGHRPAYRTQVTAPRARLCPGAAGVRRGGGRVGGAANARPAPQPGRMPRERPCARARPAPRHPRLASW